MDLNRRQFEFFALVSGIIFALLACFAASAPAQTGVVEGRMIAPRHLHPWLQRTGKMARQSQRAGVMNQTAPSSQSPFPRSPATDNLVVSDSFAGLAFPNSFGSVPPDTILAVGPAHIVELTNTTVAFYNRFTGKRLFLQDLTVFFGPVGAGNFLFDPQVTYDELAQRFVIAVLDVPAAPTAQSRGFLLYAVSNSSDPTNGFSEMQRIDVTEAASGENALPDFPRVGWNADAHVITLNMFGAVSQDFKRVAIIVIDKSSVLDANPASFVMTQTDRSNDNFTMVPAIMHDSSPGDPMWLVEESSDFPGSGIRLVKMTNVLAGSPSFTEYERTVSAYELPPNADQPGSGPFSGDCFSASPTGSGFICTNDASFLSVAWRGNRLLAAHNVGLASDSQSHARWYEFDTSGAPVLTQQETINPGFGIDTYYPSIEIASNGDLGMTFMESSASQFMSMYITGQASEDPPGHMRAPVLAKAGLGTYRAFDCFFGGVFISDCRAGDFSGISVDPNFSNMFCAANEYATASKSNNWGTWIACFSIGAHDLAVTGITAPASVLGPGPVTGAVKVTIQNRGDHSETILPANLGDGVSSGSLVRLIVSVTDDNEQCQAAVVALDATKNAALFGSGSAVVSPGKTLAVNFLVTFNCPGALPKNAADSSPADYSFSATVYHDVLDGTADVHSEDDVCPRGPLPGSFDPLPPPKGTSDKGCGAKSTNRTLGGPVTTKVVH